MSGSFSGSLLDSLAHPAQVNYLDTVDKASRAALLINANRKVQAEQLAGEAAQGAITNGVFDPVAARANLAGAGPAAALAVPEALKTASQLSSDQLAQASAHNAFISQNVAPLIQNPTDANVNAAFDRATAAGMPPAQVEAERQRFLAMSPADRQQLAYHYGVGSLTALDRLHRQTGQTEPATSPTGDVIPITTTQPAPGQSASVTQGVGSVPTIAGSTPTTLGVDAKGAPRTGTQRQFVGAAEGGPPSGLPSSLRNPNAPGAAAAPPTGGGGGVVTGLGPAAASAEQSKGTDSNTQFTAQTANDQDAQNMLGTLSTMQSDLGRFTSGTGAEKTLDWKRAVQSWAPSIAASLHIKPDEITAQESFDKNAMRIATALGTAGSDQRLTATIAANPHSGLSPEGADEIVRQLQGGADFVRAKAALARQYAAQHGTSDYQGFQSSVAALDPRVFMYDRMTDAQKHSWYNGLPKDQKPQFQQSYHDSHLLVGKAGLPGF